MSEQRAGFWRSRFLWKLYAGYALLICVSAFIIGVLTTQRIETDALSEIEQNLEIRARFLMVLAVPNFSSIPDAQVQQRVRKLGMDTQTRLTLVHVDGSVVADSVHDPRMMDNHGQRPEILAARSHGRGMVTRLSETVGERMMYLALPIRWGDQLQGYVRTAISLSEIDKRIDDLRAAHVLGASISAAIALIIGFFLARHFVNPVVKMTTVAELMAAGDYDQRLPARRQDELGNLARAFNRMAKNSRERIETIRTDTYKMSAILSAMVEGVVAIDTDESVMHMNAAAGRLLDVEATDVLGKPIWERVRIQPICEMLRASLNDAPTAQKTIRIETAVTPITPISEVVLEIDASPLRDSQGAVVGAVIVLHDCSELERLENVRREFVANASHELKTPITAIRGLVETLIDDRELPIDMQERFLGKIRDQSMRLSVLVSDLLSLSRLESKTDPRPKSSCVIGDIVTETIQAHAGSSEELGVSVDLDIQSDSKDLPLCVLGDENALAQMVSSLLDNALKYTERGKQVWVRVALDSSHDQSHVLIEVEDSGIGIHMHDQEHIFERFYRVDKARSRELGGTGLGLSIVKHIALEHGGTVAVESILGTGSTFRVRLPQLSV